MTNPNLTINLYYNILSRFVQSLAKEGLMKTESFISIEQTNLLLLIVRLVSVCGAIVWAIIPQLFVVNCNKIHLVFVYNIIIAVYTTFFIVRFFIPEGEKRACNFCLATFLFDDLVVSYFIYNTGGSSSPFYAGYFVVITIAAFVLGTRAAIITAIFGAFSFAVVQTYYGLGLYNAIEVLYRVIPLIIIAFPTSILSDALAKYIEKVSHLNGILYEKNAKLEESLQTIENMQKRLLEHEKEKAVLEFTENIAHRLRNPIMSIGGMAEILDKKIDKIESAKELKKYADYIKIESRRLSSLSDNLLEMSSRDLELKFVSIPQVIKKILAKFENRIKKYNIELKIDMDLNMPPARVDLQKFSTAIGNIVEYGIENMKNGGTLSVGVRHIISDKMIEIEISNTGMGMAKDMIDNMFEPFKAGDEGVGLPIAKHSIELMGGMIEAKSEIGKGMSFKIILPV